MPNLNKVPYFLRLHSMRIFTTRMAAQSGRTLIITPLAQLLLDIDDHLTESELSKVKLLLEVSGHIRQREGHALKNMADLLKFMFHKELIREDDLTLLIEILGRIHRQDCIKRIQKYQDEQENLKMKLEIQDLDKIEDFNDDSEVRLRRSSDMVVLRRDISTEVSWRPSSNCISLTGDFDEMDTQSNHSDEDKIRRKSSFI